jgi:glycosyltransferase involved in cell wall biosynthesis
VTNVQHVCVIVPARDEAELIERCLDAMVYARDRALETFGSRVSFSIVVVADGCTDLTAELARSFEGVHVIETGRRGVGAARARGVAHAMGSTGLHPRRLWLANTDADSEVGPDWLVDHVRNADAGADVRVGGVRPRFDDLTAEQVRAWRALHRRNQAAGHVHGANLGVRASAYLVAGGFRSLDEHEDVDLVDRLRASGARFVIPGGIDVTTSGRIAGRTPGGYASYLELQLLALADLAPSQLSGAS